MKKLFSRKNKSAETAPLKPDSTSPSSDFRPAAVPISQQGVRPGKGDIIASIWTLEDEEIKIPVEKKANGSVLFDKVCQALNVGEKDFFGLSYTDRDVRFWLDAEKSITKQLRKLPWRFRFELKFYSPDPAIIVEDYTRYLMCLQVRRDLLERRLSCSVGAHAVLGSYTVQALFGDWDTEEHGEETGYIQDIQFVPEHYDSELVQSIRENIVKMHKSIRGQTPAEAELNYLEYAKKLAMYGVDLHPVKDKDNIDLILGICASGILVYQNRTCVNRFAWPKILKLSYNKTTFYILVRSAEFETEQKQIGFKCTHPRMAKRLWKAAVEHHTFFRLRVAEKPKKSGILFNFGSKFRYSGRTFRQCTVENRIRRLPVSFQRSKSQRTMVPTHAAIGGAGFSSPEINDKNYPENGRGFIYDQSGAGYQGIIGSKMTDEDDVKLPPSQNNSLPMANLQAPADQANWEWDDQKQAWQRKFIKNGELYVEYRTERNGKVETWVEKVTVEDEDHADDDEELMAAIAKGIDVNPDLSLQRIEVDTS